MEFKTTQHGSVTVIELQGNLMGGPDAGSLNNKLHELVDAGKTKVVVDMRGVQFINSTGLGLLIGGVTTMRNAGGGLKLARASGKIAGLIKIAKLQPVFEIHTTIPDAVASFKK